MTGTGRFIFRMAVFIVLVAALVVALLPVLHDAFVHNPALNSVILGVLGIGIAYTLRQVLMLNPEIAWLERYQRALGANPTGGALVAGAPPLPTGRTRLLAPMASMLGDRRGRLSLSPVATRSLLDTIGARLDEGREISRYMIGLLVMLGLLGTFWGLIQTVGSVSEVVGHLSMSGGDAVGAFDDLKRGLARPLASMGTAFSSSLFGLAGSLVLGFLDIQAGQAQNRFYNELEEWLSGLTRIGSSGIGGGEGEASVPAYIQALLEQTADSLDGLQRTIARGEEGRSSANANLTTLAERLSVLTDQMRTEQALMVKLAENQLDMKPVLTRLAERMGGGMGLDEASKGHLRNIDIHLGRLTEDLSQGRAQTIQEVRSEIRLLARTIAALAEETDRK